MSRFFLSIVLSLAGMYFWYPRRHAAYFVPKRHEQMFEHVLHSMANKSMFVSCPFEKPRTMIFIPTFNGLFPGQFEYLETDIIFDLSPALYRPWPSHIHRFHNYVTFPLRFTKYSLREKMSLDEKVEMFRFFKRYLTTALRKIDKYPKSRLLFICSVPKCYSHFVFGMAYMDLQSEIRGSCVSTEYVFDYYTRSKDFLKYDTRYEIPKEYNVHEFDDDEKVLSDLF